MAPSLHPYRIDAGKFRRVAAVRLPLRSAQKPILPMSPHTMVAWSTIVCVLTRALRVLRRSTNQLHTSSAISGQCLTRPPPRCRCLRCRGTSSSQRSGRLPRRPVSLSCQPCSRAALITCSSAALPSGDVKLSMLNRRCTKNFRHPYGLPCPAYIFRGRPSPRARAPVAPATYSPPAS